MTEMEGVLRAHLTRYPQMLPCDAVKLCYQAEFGGGHLISDPAAALSRLLRECAEAGSDDETPLYEPVGNGLARMNLRAIGRNGVSPEALFARFLASAGAVHGTLGGFLARISAVQNLAASGAFAFDTPALNAYLSDYESQGYPPISHSDTYRRLYRPAYRIVLAK